MAKNKVFSRVFKAKIKRLIFAQAITRYKEWPFDQIELAEDYIDILSRGLAPGEKQIPRPIGLTTRYARKVRYTIKGQRKQTQ